MSSLTLKQLRYFEAVARHGHFGRAAEVCAISQPALSMQIRALEDALGLALFERGARQVRLTGFGEEFARRARQILRAVDELDELARASRGRLAGRLRIGVIPTIAPYLLPTLIGDLARAHAGLEIQWRETVTARLIEELADGRLDTAIVALPVSEPSLVEMPLFVENLLLVRPAEQIGDPVPTPEALRDMGLLLLEEGHCFRDQALAFCDIAASGRRDGLDGSSLSTLVQMVGAKIGVTVIPELAATVETRSAPVSLARFGEPQPTRTVGMVWRRTSPLGAQLAQVGAIVRQRGEMLRTAQHAGSVDADRGAAPRQARAPL